jgi:protein phosphatase
VVGFEIKEHASLSDVGVRRSHNQDSFAIMLASDPEAWNDRGHVFLVADGMGAHAVGELASKLAADLIPHNYQKYANQGPTHALRRAFHEANATINQRGQANQEFRGMGTTGTALILRPEGAWLAHVGDSRCYRIRGWQTEQISFDHSLQWELAKRQKVDPSKLTGIPSNVIVRSLGPEPNVQVDVEGPHPLQPGDAFLLCSDGLSNQISDQELGAVISTLPLEEACQFLVDLANLRGGPDNITVITVRLAGQGPEDDSAAPAPARGGRLIHRLPWAGIAFGLGIGLAILALVLKDNGGLALATFGLALAMLVVGFIGLYKSYQEDQRRLPDDEPGPPQVHRRTACRIDAALLQKIMQTGANLQELAKEKNWPINWARHEKLLQAATTHAQKGDLVAAFREQCRAMGLLFEAVRNYRDKGEAFKPNW